MSKRSTELAVIGAGPGGYPAAFLAADKGMNVVLIDPEMNPGGVCLYRGCIPTKTLLHVSDVMREAKDAEMWGLKFNDPEIDLDKLRLWKNRVVQKMTGGLGQLAKQRKIEYIQGRAVFLDSQTLEITKQDGSKEKLKFKKAILATGSSSAELPNIQIKSKRILNSSQAMELHDIPKTLLVLGGGYIGLEMGTIYATLGSEVTVVEMLPNILPGADLDLIRVYSQTARKQFGYILTSTLASEMEEKEDGIQVTFRDRDGNTKIAVYEKILVTIGRKPNSKGLGLENTKVKEDDKGFVKVNPQRQTADPNIYAVGDVVGGAMLAHKATHEGRVAVEAICGCMAAFEPRAIPAVLFTNPEVAWCGITENEAMEKGLQVSISKFPWGASGRAASLGRMDGVTKLIVDTTSERILGVGIVGPGAGELIAEGALAIEAGLTVSDMSRTIHPHPTLSETLMEAAEVFHGKCTHVYRPKR